jgi:hypothetical protein
LFPHACEQHGCDSRPIYDDEPYCFTHSPDEGSSFRGYSAYAKSLVPAFEPDPDYIPF